MGQQKITLETSNTTLGKGEQITVDIFHEVERETTESGATKLSLSIFFNNSELQLDSINYPSSSFQLSLNDITLEDNNDDDGNDETNTRTLISFQQASLQSPYPDAKTKIATASFTALENFDGSEVSAKIPLPTSQTYNNAPSEVFATKTLNLELEAANNAPSLTGTIATLPNGTEDTAYILNASNLLQGFTDGDGDNLSAINLQITNGNLTDNNNGTWTFNPNVNFNGTVNLLYNISDGKEGIISANQSFLVNPIDDVPVLKNAIADIIREEDADNTVIDLNNVFTDIDNEDSAIIKNLSSNSNENLVTASITDNNLTLDYQNNQSGTANIIIQGTSNGKAVEDSFTITVNPINDAPTLVNKIPSIVTAENKPFSFTIPKDTFNDVDTQDNLIYTATELPNWLTFDATTQTLNGTPQNSDIGISDLKIIATDNSGATAEDTFSLIVKALEDLPRLSLSNLVANKNTNSTMSLTLSNSEAANKIEFAVTYDTDLLDINAIAPSQDLPSNWKLTQGEIDEANGLVKVTLEGTDPLTGSNLNLGDILRTLTAKLYSVGFSTHAESFLRCTCLDIATPGSTHSADSFLSPQSTGTTLFNPRCRITRPLA